MLGGVPPVLEIAIPQRDRYAPVGERFRETAASACRSPAGAVSVWEQWLARLPLRGGGFALKCVAALNSAMTTV